MREDQRFDRYLSARAAGLELPPASLAAVMDRAARRHRHRRAAVSACAAVTVLTGALSVANLGGAPATDHVVARPANGILVQSSLGWTVVTPKAGLSWATSTVVGPGNALYSLSTAPGSVAADNEPMPSTLYRSSDGIEWKATALPDNLRASSLATTDQLLYAVGTAPAGGSTRAVQLASTNGAGAPWTRATLPFNVDALEARYGVKIGLGRLTVASNGTRAVVAVRVQVDEGIDRFLPAGVDASQGGYGVTDTGIDVYAKPAVIDKKSEVRTPQAPVVTASYTWEQLGIDASLRSLILGETRLFVADDGVTFTEAPAPNPVRMLGALLATTDGFSLVGSTSSSAATVESWKSVDGHAWVSDGAVPTPGYVLASGTRRGQAAVVVAAEQSPGEQSASVRVQQRGGAWDEIRLTDLLHQAGVTGDYSPSSAAVGPLAVAVVMSEYGVDGGAHHYLVTTTDGIEASVTDLSPFVGDGDGYPGDVRVSADAITVTVAGSTPQSALRLVVGTPSR